MAAAIIELAGNVAANGRISCLDCRLQIIRVYKRVEFHAAQFRFPPSEGLDPGWIRRQNRPVKARRQHEFFGEEPNALALRI